MEYYFVVKVLHIVSATLLFGTGLGTAFFKWATDRSGNVSAIRVVSERVVLADWLFTTPAALVQLLTGIYLATLLGYPLNQGWVLHAFALYLLAGLCWLPVLWLQMRMRALARAADAAGGPLDPRYWFLARIWFWLGVAAFASLLVVFWLMVRKPAL